MNAVWLIVWVSTQATVVNDRIESIAWMDHYSIRPTREAANDWVRTLKEHGAGFDFHIFQAKKED